MSPTPSHLKTLEEIERGGIPGLMEVLREEGLDAVRHALWDALEHTKQALVEAFGTGLKLGIAWMPPQLRHEVYQALGLRVVVDEAGGMRVEARVDTATIRFSQQVERYARALREADERLQREEAENPAKGYEVTVPDPEGNPAKLRVTAHQERLERAERELAQLRRELSSPTITAITSSEISKFA